MAEPESARDFEGTVALVTGGASGIGLATARLLAERGAEVAVLDRSVSGVDGDLHTVRADVADAAAVEAAVSGVISRFGTIDVLVNNAGMPASGTVADNDDEEWRRVLDVNVVGMVRTTREALPHLRRSRAAAIVNTCSVAATCGMPGLALYSASKGAVLALTLAMATDFLDQGIRVNCVCPATVDSPWLQPRLAEADDAELLRATLAARQPSNSLVGTGEVAAAIAYLASPLSGSTTGTVLEVDGGFTRLRVPPRES